MGERAMMKRRIKLISALAILAPLFLAAVYQSELIGWWRGEAKYQGRYTHSWRAELRTYDIYFGYGSVWHWDWTFFRRPSWWERWCSKLLPKPYESYFSTLPPLQDGDPEAGAVLTELLQAPEKN